MSYQVESKSGMRSFEGKREAIAFGKRLAEKGKASRIAGPNGPLAMFAAKKAALDACRTYGVKLSEMPGEAVYPMQQKAMDPAMEEQRQRSGVDDAFDANATKVDRPVPSLTPEPGTINRAEG